MGLLAGSLALLVCHWRLRWSGSCTTGAQLVPADVSAASSGEETVEFLTAALVSRSSKSSAGNAKSEGLCDTNDYDYDLPIFCQYFFLNSSPELEPCRKWCCPLHLSPAPTQIWKSKASGSEVSCEVKKDDVLVVLVHTKSAMQNLWSWDPWPVQARSSCHWTSWNLHHSIRGNFLKGFYLPVVGQLWSMVQYVSILIFLPVHDPATLSLHCHYIVTTLSPQCHHSVTTLSPHPLMNKERKWCGHWNKGFSSSVGVKIIRNSSQMCRGAVGS